MNGYVCFYQGKRVEIYADTAFGAVKAAALRLHIPAKKMHLISVVLAEKDGQPVLVDPASL